jgi:nitroreductase
MEKTRHMQSVEEAIRQRQSVRTYKRRPVPEEMIVQMLEAARLAPSASNSQPWRFIVVTDIEEKKQLREMCFGAQMIEDAGVVFVACSDLSSYSPQSYLKRRQEAVDAGVFPASTLKDPAFLARVNSQPDLAVFAPMAIANTYIAVEHIVLMATALGLGSCWIGAIGDHDGIKRLLKIPSEMMLVALVTVGYVEGKPPRRPHLSMNQILLRPFPASTME